MSEAVGVKELSTERLSEVYFDEAGKKLLDLCRGQNVDEKEITDRDEHRNRVFQLEIKDKNQIPVPIAIKKSANTANERLRWRVTRETYPKRTMACYIVSEMMGFGVVPTVALRGDESLMQFVESQPFGDFVDKSGSAAQEVQKMEIALLSLIAWNTDALGNVDNQRIDKNGRIWQIDVDLCFGDDAPDKQVEKFLADRVIPHEIAKKIIDVAYTPRKKEAIEERLSHFLSPDEVTACLNRIDCLAEVLAENLWEENGQWQHVLPAKESHRWAKFNPV